jgi:hypothetical protein
MKRKFSFSYGGTDLRKRGSQAGISVFLALLILTAFLLPSMGLGEQDERLYVNVAFSVLFISGLAIAWGRRTLFLLSSAVFASALTVQWIGLWTPFTTTLGLWRQGMTICAVLILVLVLMLEVFRSGPVTHMRIEGAIAVYLLLGTGWAHAYHLAAILKPHSFVGFGGEPPALSAWMYYSFVTLTTLGYGDVVPIRPVARSLAVGEALTGQLYLTVLLARLVALQISSSGNRPSAPE